MHITDEELRRIWALSMAGDPGAVAKKQSLHAQNPELDARFERYKVTINRIRTEVPKKPKRNGFKGEPTTWTRAKDKFQSSTTGNVVLVQGGSTGLKR